MEKTLSTLTVSPFVAFRKHRVMGIGAGGLFTSNSELNNGCCHLCIWRLCAFPFSWSPIPALKFGTPLLLFIYRSIYSSASGSRVLSAGTSRCLLLLSVSFSTFDLVCRCGRGRFILSLPCGLLHPNGLLIQKQAERIYNQTIGFFFLEGKEKRRWEGFTPRVGKSFPLVSTDRPMGAPALGSSEAESRDGGFSQHSTSNGPGILERVATETKHCIADRVAGNISTKSLCNLQSFRLQNKHLCNSVCFDWQNYYSIAYYSEWLVSTVRYLNAWLNFISKQQPVGNRRFLPLCFNS